MKSAISFKNLNRNIESLHQIERTVFWPLEDCGDSRGGERDVEGRARVAVDVDKKRHRRHPLSLL